MLPACQEKPLITLPQDWQAAQLALPLRTLR
jgi:hypothetical protein